MPFPYGTGMAQKATGGIGYRYVTLALRKLGASSVCFATGFATETADKNGKTGWQIHERKFTKTAGRVQIVPPQGCPGQTTTLCNPSAACSLIT